MTEKQDKEAWGNGQPGYKPIDNLATDETIFFHRTKDMRFLECAIELMQTDYRPDEVAAILRKQAEIVENYG